MRKTQFNYGWTIRSGMEGPFDAIFAPSNEARPVTLPHDAMIEEERDPGSPSGAQYGFYPAKCYTYLKTFPAPAEWEQETVMVEFEGVMRRAMVYLNGHFIGGNAYGYTGFTVCLDPYLQYGRENTLKVLALNDERSSRWYPGSGIYRDVWLLQGGKTWFVPGKQRVTTVSLEEGYALLRLEGKLAHNLLQPQRLTLEARLFDPDGRVAAETVLQTAVAREGENRWHTQLTLDAPVLWSPEAPALYTCRLTLRDGSAIVDQWEDRAGIRTLALDARQGLRVNGVETKLRGACIHHDNGVIGAASFLDAERFRMRNLKAAGFNAIRSAHHPAGPALLKACDEVGILVMDELSDMWNVPMNTGDFGLDFQNSWEAALEQMVDKDYNHPCVIMYSTGNEIPEIGRVSGWELNQRIAEELRRQDPTRYSTFGLNGLLAVADVPDIGEMMKHEPPAEPQAESAGAEELNQLMGSAGQQDMDAFSVMDILTDRVEPAASAVDVVGYNYLTARHELEHQNHPDRVVVGSETYPPEIARLWEIVERCHHVIGDFTWTGYDYLGEAGIGIPHYNSEFTRIQGGWPDRLAYCGDIDLNASRRPVSFLRELAFGLGKGPCLAVERADRHGMSFDYNGWKYADCLASWTFPGYEGKPVWVRVLARCGEVELLLNGQSLGRKKAGELERLTTLFQVEYQPGQLTAIAYENGVEVGRDTLTTAGPAAALRLTADRETISAGGQGLAFITADLTDAAGNWNRWEQKEVAVEVEGPGVLLGFGSAAPSTEGSYQSPVCSTWDGRVMAVVRSLDVTGEVRARFTAPGCESAEIVITTE